MQDITSPLDNLPLEILYSLMKFMDGCDLYLFSMTCRRLYTMISNSEELWDDCYALSVPQIHRALLQPPVPSYWAFSEPMSRRFIYLCVVVKNRRTINDMDSVIEVMRKNTHSEGLLLIASYIIRRLTFTPPECKPTYKDKVSRNRLYFGQNGAIGLLLDLLSQDQLSCATLMSAILCALNNLCCNIGRNCRIIIREDGISTILNIMKKYSSDVSVLDYGSAVLANISREIKGDWTDLIVSEGINLTKKLLESEVLISIDSIVSGVDLVAVLAKTNSRFRKSFGREVLPLIKDLLVKHKDEPSLVMSCSRALLEFFHCPDNNSLVEELDLIPQLLNRLENERDNTLAFYIISALNSLFWKKTVSGKDYFYRYVTIVIDRLKKGLVEKKFELPVALILGNIANHDADNLKLIKSFQISKIMLEVIKKHPNGHEKYHHIINLFKE